MVPEGWQRKPIKEVCESIIDCVNKTAKVVEQVTPYKMIRTTNVRNGRVNTVDVRYVTKDVYDQWVRRGAPKKGDLIFTREAPVGEIGVLEDDEGVFLGQRTMMYRVDSKKGDNYFLFYSLQSRFCQKQIEDLSNGGTVAHMRVPDCGEIIVNIPPLLEQKKIAKIISTWDKAITITEQLLSDSKAQKKSLMQKLLTGEKRFDEFEKTELVLRKGFSKKKLGKLPKDWNVENISDFFWYQEGPGVRKHQFTESGVKLFNGTNIQFNRVTLDNTLTHISNDEAYGPYKHFLADEGDLVIACSGISVDRFNEKIGFIKKEHLPLCMNTSTMRFKSLDSKKADIKYFQYFMKSPLFKNQIRRQITGSAQLNFGPSHIGKCYVVLPSIDEQRKISSVLIAADRDIEILQQKIEFFKLEKKALMQQLLTGQRRVKL